MLHPDGEALRDRTPLTTHLLGPLPNDRQQRRSVRDPNQSGPRRPGESPKRGLHLLSRRHIRSGHAHTPAIGLERVLSASLLECARHLFGPTRFEEEIRAKVAREEAFDWETELYKRLQSQVEEYL